MIIIGVGQRLAGIFLAISGALLYVTDMSVMGMFDIAFGAYLMWCSIDRHDPPGGLIRV